MRANGGAEKGPKDAPPFGKVVTAGRRVAVGVCHQGVSRAMASLFSPLRLGAITLPNRIVMAPLTRCRATPGTFAANEMMAKHYADRASAGLLIAEATVISEEARGFPNTPGCYNAAQAAGWRLVTDAVHAAGGRIFLQLWHQGRTASRALNGGVEPVGPSAVAGWKTGFGGVGEAPREATEADIARILGDYRAAARTARWIVTSWSRQRIRSPVRGCLDGAWAGKTHAHGSCIAALGYFAASSVGIATGRPDSASLFKTARATRS